MKKLILTTIGLVAFGAVVFFIMPQKVKDADPVSPEGRPAAGEAVPRSGGAPPATLKTYSSSSLGVMFRYPDMYFLEENNIGSGERAHYELVLTADTEENRRVRSGLEPGREGPVAISFGFYDNRIEKLTAEKWIKDTSYSNFKLSDGTHESTTVAGVRALHYFWSGLYGGESIVFRHDGYVVVASVTFLEKTDHLRADFTEILKTLRLYEPAGSLVVPE